MLTNGEGKNDTLHINNYNFNWNYVIGNLDIYIDKDTLLRTHTSGSQIHYMNKNKPPIKILSLSSGVCCTWCPE